MPLTIEQYQAMTLDGYQSLAEDHARYPNPGTTDGAIYLALGLAGEAGEVANKMKKMLRDDGGMMSEARRAAILDECGDTLWYLVMLARELGTDLSAVVAMNRAKLEARNPTGVGG